MGAPRGLSEEEEEEGSDAPSDVEDPPGPPAGLPAAPGTAVQASPCARRAIINYRKNGVATKRGEGNANREAPTALEADITRVEALPEYLRLGARCVS